MPGVTAFKGNVNLELHLGKVNAIIGENGAREINPYEGVVGVYVDYEGAIIYNNELIGKTLPVPKNWKQKGIGIIYQELNLCRVWGYCIENIFWAVSVALLAECSIKKKWRGKPEHCWRKQNWMH